jgi:hypothetical protein
MRGLFGREIDEHTTSLRRSAELIRHIDEVALADLSVEMEIGEQIKGPPSSQSYSTTASALPRSGSLGKIMVAGALLAAGVAGGMWWQHSRRSAAPTVAPATATVASPAHESELPAMPAPSVAVAAPTSVTAPPVTAPAGAAPSEATPIAAADAPAAPLHPSRVTPKRIVPIKKAASVPIRAPAKPVALSAATAKPAAATAKPAAPTAAPPAAAPPKAALPQPSPDDKSPRPMTSFE